MREKKNIIKDIERWQDINNQIRRRVMLHNPKIINQIMKHICSEIEEKINMKVSSKEFSEYEFRLYEESDIAKKFHIYVHSNNDILVFDIKIEIGILRLQINIDLNDELLERYGELNNIVCNIFKMNFFELYNINNDIDEFYIYSNKYREYDRMFNLEYLKSDFFNYNYIFILLEELKNTGVKYEF